MAEYANGVYNHVMLFIETPTFTRLLLALLSDEEYRALQNTLLEDPECGDLVQGGGGIRKLRHGRQGGGKRGWGRVIEDWRKAHDEIYLLLIDPKGKRTI